MRSRRARPPGVRPKGVPAMTPAYVKKVVADAIRSGPLPADAAGWTVSKEVEDPDLLGDAPGVYFIAEMVRQPGGRAPSRIARYIGQSANVRVETRKQRACKWMGGCEGRARIFALYTGGADTYWRRLLEWAFHQDFKPTVSTARRPRRK